MKLLMTPGPTVVPERILNALAKPIVHHRTPEFTELLKSCSERMKKVYKTQNDLFLITGSGTSAMDAALSNTIHKGDKVLSLVSGKFSERLRDIAFAYGADVKTLDFEWGSGMDLGQIEENLDEDTKLLTIVHNETSTGVKNPVAEIGKLVKDTNTLLAVDVISSLGGDDIRTDEWGIDLCIAGSQKCLAMPPGLAFLSVSEKAWKVIDDMKSAKYYLDLSKYKKKYPQTPFTPAISLIVALDEALNMVEEEGLENRIKRHEKNAKLCRAGITKLGLKFLPEREDIMSVTLTAMKDDRSEAIRIALKEKHDILVAGGQVHLKGKIFRIGHMGFIGKEEIERTLDALTQSLEELK